MKRISYILTIALGLLLSSCDDFFDKEPQGNINSENYYRTKYQLQEALNAVYDILQSDMYNNSEWIFGEACGDDVLGNDESGSNMISKVVNFTFDSSNEWILKRYQVNYRGINRANQLIANINKVELSSLNLDNYIEVRAILGQAKFLRALFYFNLVKTFGGVPIRPEQEDINDLVIPRSTKEDVYAYIEKDLREASICLNAKYMDSSAGKVGSAACIAYLMKVLMYQCTPGERSDKWEEIVALGDYFIKGTPMTYADILHLEDYQESWDEISRRLWFKPKELLTSKENYVEATQSMPQISNLYSLEATSRYDGSILNYRDLYNEPGEFCSRSVFEIVFKQSADGTTGDNNEGTGIMQDLLMNRLWASTSFQNEVANDPRKNDLILLHASATFDGERLEVPAGRYGCMKWYTPKSERPKGSDDYGKNRRVMIYSEVVLTYAEALNEVDRRQDALEQINRIKTEANKITGIATLYKPGTYLEMRNQIWTERRIELCHLWDRFFDIVRQGRAATILHNHASATLHMRGKFFKEGVNEIFPIPQNEIDITNGIVAQNPGY